MRFKFQCLSIKNTKYFVIMHSGKDRLKLRGGGENSGVTKLGLLLLQPPKRDVKDGE